MDVGLMERSHFHSARRQVQFGGKGSAFLSSPHTHTTLKRDLYHCYPSHKDVLSDFLFPLQCSLLNQPEVMQARVMELRNLLILPQEQRGKTIDGIISVKLTPDDAVCDDHLFESQVPLFNVSTHSLLLLQPQKL